MTVEAVALAQGRVADARGRVATERFRLTRARDRYAKHPKDSCAELNLIACEEHVEEALGELERAEADEIAAVAAHRAELERAEAEITADLAATRGQRRIA